MARLKALFITLYPLAAALMCGHALWRWWQQGDWLWAGVLLVNAPILLRLAWLVGRGSARGGTQLVLATVCAWFGAAITLLGTLSLGDPRPLAWAYCAAGLVGLCVCLLWYQPVRAERNDDPRPGQNLPSRALVGLDGEPVSTSSLLGRPAVILFFRGSWCSLCMAQLRELRRRQPQLERRGARLVVISAQPANRAVRLAQRLNLGLEWWVDPQLALARCLGIIDPGGTPLGLGLLGYSADTVLPTVLITDSRGEILYVDQFENARARPEPVAFLRVLDTMTLAPR